MSYRRKDAKSEELEPVIEGRCNAVLRKRPYGSRCRQIPREGEARCPFHRGYTEPEAL